MPELVREPLGRLEEVFAPDEYVSLLARLDGVPVGCGSGFVHDGVLGVYNIATLEEARGRGIGYAVTAALLAEGRRRGCRHAVLHASEEGRPVYERLGFEAVCDVPQYVWLPPEAAPSEHPTEPGPVPQP
jgi:GNAT superfamily N-acetyltransferase